VVEEEFPPHPKRNRAESKIVKNLDFFTILKPPLNKNVS
jgi:hypothetical protein